ncbi:hypothetical protein CHLRE_06g289400v5 [Chlamydomonas reinhardtii]|uniref:Phosphodiesterase n=1 Tax=Chlamydomonas reinhardtii TaxID=3055 RepID=A0A2K3DQ61_CHLRE|nr:uncharacterized protein CHLRE_06g289400v5 [Chlamydomonas reinhardtii]PNW82682.1 hypothetical protein CHLRE_06g289400v5 [Chlamydomonas reinhardtii]
MREPSRGRGDRRIRAAFVRAWQRVLNDTKNLCRLVVHYPSTTIIPLLVLAVVVGVGVWGITRVAEADASGAKNRATALAIDTASSFRQHLDAGSLAPIMALAALVQHDPSYAFLSSIFPSFVPVLASQVPGNAIRSLQLAPFGVIRMIWPLAGNQAAFGLDLFASATERDGAVKTVEDHKITLVGPMTFRQGGYGVRVRMPIFVSNVSQGRNTSFGGPDPLNDYCGAPCYDATNRTLFWGFATALVDLNLLSNSSDSRLRGLEQQGFDYELLAPAAAANLSVIARSGSDLGGREVVEAVIDLPNNKWVLRLAPHNGVWMPTWYAPLLAGVVVLGVALAALIFAVLVTRRQHQMLLEALLPREVIRDLVSRDAASAGPRIMQADTAADVLLKMMGCLLEGSAPDLRDVLFIRTTVLRNLDIYAPLNLSSHIKEANYDADVAQALMQQLGGAAFGGAANDHLYDELDDLEVDNQLPYGVDDHGAYDELGEMDGAGGGGGAADPCETLGGALALLMTPQPAIWYGGGGGGGDDFDDAKSDAALPTVVTECAVLTTQGSIHSNAESVRVAAVAASMVGTASVVGGGGGGGGDAFDVQSRQLSLSLTAAAPAAAGPGAGGVSSAAAAAIDSWRRRSRDHAREHTGQAGAGRMSNSLSGMLAPPGAHGPTLPHSPQAATAAGAAAAVAAANQTLSGSHGNVFLVPMRPATVQGLQSAAGASKGLPTASAHVPQLPAVLTSPVPLPSLATDGAAGTATAEENGPSQCSSDAADNIVPSGAGRPAPPAVVSSGGGVAGGHGLGAYSPLLLSTAGTPHSARLQPSNSQHIQHSVSGGAGSPLLGAPPQSSTTPGGLSGGGGAGGASLLQQLLHTTASGAAVGAGAGAGAAVGAGAGGGSAARFSASADIPTAAVVAGAGDRVNSAGGRLMPPRSPLGGLRIKRAQVSPGPGQVGGGGGGSLSATFSGALLSASQLCLTLPEDRHSSRLGGGQGGSVVGGGGGGGGNMLQTLTARRQAMPPPPSVIMEVERLLAGADGWQFDTWRLREATQGHPLSTLGFFLLQRSGIISRFKLSGVTVARFLRHIEAGYPDNPYHSATHAADVLQTLHVIIHGAQLHVHYLDALGLFAAYFAAIVHDYGHPGLTNDFLIATSDPLAVRYNDKSPLENHHAAAAFSVLRRSEVDVLSTLTLQERNTFRKQVIEMVLATDMKQHFTTLSHFQTMHRLASFQQVQQAALAAASGAAPSPAGGHSGRNLMANGGGGGGAGGAAVTPSERSATLLEHMTAPRPKDDMERMLGLQVAMKAADLGHLGEELEVHKRWLAGLEEEFFNQGDREKELGIPISPLFDRAKQGVSKSQVGFYDFVALPLVHALTSAFPGSKPLMKCFARNYAHWKSVEAAAAAAPTAGGGSTAVAASPSGKAAGAAAAAAGDKVGTPEGKGGKEGKDEPAGADVAASRPTAVLPASGKAANGADVLQRQQTAGEGIAATRANAAAEQKTPRGAAPNGRMPATAAGAALPATPSRRDAIAAPAQLQEE